MPRFSSPVIAPAFLGAGILTNPFAVNFYVGSSVNPTEDQGASGVERGGRSPKTSFGTIQAAVNEALSGRGDIIWVQRGARTESVNFNKAGLTVVGMSPYGYPDHVTIAGSHTVNASNITFVNMEFFSNSATATAVHVGTTTEVNSIWFDGCSFASDGTTIPQGGVALYAGNNLTFNRCVFSNQTFGIRLLIGLDSLRPSHLMIQNCEFYENITADISDILRDTTPTGINVLAAGASARSGTDDAKIIDNVFGGGITIPTRFLNITGTSTGIISGNRFATATNAASVITIPAGLLYAANATEAGWSTARPA